MSVNGIELAVGQTWETRDGRTAVIHSVDDPYVRRCVAYPVKGCVTGKTIAATCLVHWTHDGLCIADRQDNAYDLIELVIDEHGFTIWNGGAQPEETKGRTVEYRYADGGGSREAADQLRWSHESAPDRPSGDIHAYRIVDDYPLPIEMADAPDANELAAEMLSALGFHFTGQAWVKDEATTLKPAPTSAIDTLDRAAGHMRARAATYDKPKGERSMAQTVAIFNLHHDTALTEAQGWHFMEVLKNVRLFTREGYHADSGEDGVAYAALKCEAKAKEGGAA